jgi:hypothetical protein
MFLSILSVFLYMYLSIDAAFRYFYISTYLLHHLDTMYILPLPLRRGRMYMVYILPLPSRPPPVPSLLPWLPDRRSKRALKKSQATSGDFFLAHSTLLFPASPPPHLTAPTPHAPHPSPVSPSLPPPLLSQVHTVKALTCQNFLFVSASSGTNF